MSGNDLSKYRDMFVQEANEHIQNLNQALLQLEQNPENKECLDSAFRSAHTLKGMAATMGYEQIRQICRAIEDLFDKFRNGQLRLMSQSTDFFFYSFDLLEKMVNDEKYSVDLIKFTEEFEKVAEAESDKTESKQNMPPDATMTPTSGQTTSNTQGSMYQNDQQYDQRPESPAAQSADNNFATQPSFQSSTNYGGRLDTSAHINTQSVKVRMEDLDSLVDLVGEIMIARMRLEQVVLDSNLKEYKQELRNLERLINALQSHTMKIRLVPIQQIFDRFPRMVRDISADQGKEVRLEMEGTSIELDRTVLDAITDPLLHILRNAVDHGIEMPKDREALGKPGSGTIKLKAHRVGDKVSIEVSDDGRGIDLDKVKEKAVEKGIISRQDADAMSSEQITDLLGTSGLSTAQKVTDISGRGVGVNVVIDKIKSVGGTVKIRTEKNLGTTFSLTIPLSLAIIGGLLVKVGSEKYVIPLSDVLATIQVDQNQVKIIQGRPVIIFRSKVIPLVHAADVLQTQKSPAQINTDNSISDNTNKLTVIVAEKAGKPIGMIVDSFESKQDIVIKHIDKTGYHASSNVPSDATILSDGKVALILDLMQLQMR
jgi:two-component system chemotaxis sensor kinase CheA